MSDTVLKKSFPEEDVQDTHFPMLTHTITHAMQLRDQLTKSCACQTHWLILGLASVLHELEEVTFQEIDIHFKVRSHKNAKRLRV